MEGPVDWLFEIASHRCSSEGFSALGAATTPLPLSLLRPPPSALRPPPSYRLLSPSEFYEDTPACNHLAYYS